MHPIVSEDSRGIGGLPRKPVTAVPMVAATMIVGLIEDILNVCIIEWRVQLEMNADLSGTWAKGIDEEKGARKEWIYDGRSRALIF